MKTLSKPVVFGLFAALLVTASVMAQTNIITFTSHSGVVVSNAEAVKISESKILYRSPAAQGVVFLKDLPPEIQSKFNYDPDKAAAAEKAKTEERAREAQTRAAAQAYFIKEQAEIDADKTDSSFRNQTRWFSAGWVDLLPLFHWWRTGESIETDKRSEKPLSAWAIVRGTKYRESGYGWIMYADIFDTPTNAARHEWIYLADPPKNEERQFYALYNNYIQAIQDTKWAHQKTENLVQSELENRSASQFYENVARATGSSQSENLSQATHTREKTIGVQSSQWSARMHTAADNQAAARLAMESIPHRGDLYYVDYFALKTGTTNSGLPVYDMGSMY
jgi:hypothetical protein